LKGYEGVWIVDPQLGCCLGRDNNANKTVWVLKIEARVHTAQAAVTPAAQGKSAYPGAESRECGKEMWLKRSWE
jgi:hypothetical protein